jgi:hypothetical protein
MKLIKDKIHEDFKDSYSGLVIYRNFFIKVHMGVNLHNKVLMNVNLPVHQQVRNVIGCGEVFPVGGL